MSNELSCPITIARQSCVMVIIRIQSTPILKLPSNTNHIIMGFNVFDHCVGNHVAHAPNCLSGGCYQGLLDLSLSSFGVGLSDSRLYYYYYSARLGSLSSYSPWLQIVWHDPPWNQYSQETAKISPCHFCSCS
jgi:hypothetical protein